MLDLSIIIVNYNVKYFLDQCLQSINKNKSSLKVEVWVVDNDSKDGSVDMVKQKYPKVNLIANNHNPGFAIANNQAINLSNSKYVLLLNPDTLLQEDSLDSCFSLMENDASIGAMGIKMLDGTGNYLPESKRGLPGLWNSFSYMAGLGRIFPKSKLFNHYHLGYLDKEENHYVEVLSGAYMFMRTSALEKVGLLDEDFFMYGEDVDLSHRFAKAGYKCFYNSDSSIIHFKGESTKKGSLNYTKHFYQAMILFNTKHFVKTGWLLKFLLPIVIFFGGLISYVKIKVRPLILPLLDGLSIITILFIVKSAWALFYHKDSEYYASIPFLLLALLFTSIYLISFFLTGFYDKKTGITHFVQGWLLGGLGVFLAYSFLSEELRFSRFIILLSFPLIFFLLALLRKFINGITTKDWSFSKGLYRKYILVGTKGSIQEMEHFFSKGPKVQMIGAISPDNNEDEFYIGALENLQEIATAKKPNEIIFCSGDISNKRIFEVMENLGDGYSYRIGSMTNDSIIGSDSKNQSGTWLTTNLDFAISNVTMKRQKRVLDIIMALVFISLFPLILLVSKQRKMILSNIFSVLFGSKTWVGYIKPFNLTSLPEIKPSVFNHIYSDPTELDTKSDNQRDYEYAQSYSIWKDLLPLLYNLRP